MNDYVDTEELCFADWLRQTITKNEIKQSELARGLSTEEHEVNRSTISLWLSGDRLPKDNLRARLAEYFVTLGVGSYGPMIKEILWCVHVSEMRKTQ